MTAGICRWLVRRGVKVAPFKGQNMSLNSFVTREGAEIGRAQAMQAQAARVEPSALMNPVLLKPGGDRSSQVVLMGRPVGELSARGYHGGRQQELLGTVVECLEELRATHDAVICEGAGSPAEINLRRNDIVNMGVARAAGFPVVVVGDIDRGGVFAQFFGTTALLAPEDQALVAGYLVNKFRGDVTLLEPGLDMLYDLTGRRTFGVLPYARGLGIDEEDGMAVSLRGAVRESAVAPPVGEDVLRVAVCAVPLMSNFTDVDALAAEPGVVVRFVDRPEELADADLVVVPGTRGTVRALAWLRERGLAAELARRAAEGRPVLGICGGFQALGEHIEDDVESRAGAVEALGLLPVRVRFAPEKTLARPVGEALGERVEGTRSTTASRTCGAASRSWTAAASAPCGDALARVAGVRRLPAGVPAGGRGGGRAAVRPGARHVVRRAARGAARPARRPDRGARGHGRAAQADRVRPARRTAVRTAGGAVSTPGAVAPAGTGARRGPARAGSGAPRRPGAAAPTLPHAAAPRKGYRLMASVPYPFTAVVGMDDMRLSLLLTAVSPRIGGVLVRGEKGTAKSTLVRSSPRCCPHGRRPRLPLLVRARGARPGVPGRAARVRAGRPASRAAGRTARRRLGGPARRGAGHRAGAVRGREGLRAGAAGAGAPGHPLRRRGQPPPRPPRRPAARRRRHGRLPRGARGGLRAARGALPPRRDDEPGGGRAAAAAARPVRADRGGGRVADPEQRVEVVRRRLAYEDDPVGFAARWAGEEAALRERIAAARALLPQVRLGEDALRRIAATCAAFEVDGMRADIVMARTATALAAWAGRTDVTVEDVRQAALLALPHRRRRSPFDAPGLDEDRLDEVLEQSGGGDEPEPDPRGPGDGGPDGDGGPGDGAPAGAVPAGAFRRSRRDPGRTPRPRPRRSRPGSGRRRRPPRCGTGSAAGRGPGPRAVAGRGGRTVPHEGADRARRGRRRGRAPLPGAHRARPHHRVAPPAGALTKLHLAATVQAAAPHQRARGRSGPGLVVHRDDLRQAVREGREGNLVLFVVDASGSMAARQRMGAVKGAVLSLLLDAYQRRDKVGLVTFRGRDAELVLPPTSSVDAAAARLERLPTGAAPAGGGPAEGARGAAVGAAAGPGAPPAARRGHGRAGDGGPEPLRLAARAAGLHAAEGTASVVVDCESGPVRLGLAAGLARDLGGTAVTLDELRADAIAGLVKDVRTTRRAA